jgi:hypothetical protein
MDDTEGDDTSTGAAATWPIGDSLHAGLGKAETANREVGAHGDSGGSLFREFRIEEMNGMCWVMGVTGDMVTETSMIFGSGGEIRPDRLGAVLVWFGSSTH